MRIQPFNGFSFGLNRKSISQQPTRKVTWKSGAVLVFQNNDQRKIMPSQEIRVILFSPIGCATTPGAFHLKKALAMVTSDK
jgi:hypothetical protein